MRKRRCVNGVKTFRYSCNALRTLQNGSTNEVEVDALSAVCSLSRAREYPRADCRSVEGSTLFSHVLPGFCLLPVLADVSVWFPACDTALLRCNVSR